MKGKTLYRLILFVIFVILFFSLSRFITSLYSLPFESKALCIRVIDGDTFDVDSGYRIRLADVNTPEMGYQGSQEAKDFLYDRIYGKVIYLDIDDDNFYDTTGTRVVCLVYVEYEPGKYLNLNQALLDENLAVIDDHPNEFNPFLWRTVVYGLSLQSRFIIVGFSFITSVSMIFIINKTKNRLSEYIKRK